MCDVPLGTASVEKRLRLSVERPVAIARFTAPHGDADAKRFAEALTRDLLTRLGRVGAIEGKVLSDNPVYLRQAETNVIPGLLKAGIPEK